MAPTGRIPKLTPAVHKSIVKCVGAGVPYKYAAMRAGVSESAMAKWLAAARKARQDGADEPTLIQFLHDIEAARSKHVANMVARIVRASSKSWQAAAWWLERMCREFSSDKAELRELRNLVKQMAAERGSNGAGDGNTPGGATPSVEQDDGGDDGPPAGQAPG